MIVPLLITFFSIFVQCKATSWPDGKYCLPMPQNGKCPRGWRSGYRNHATINQDESHHIWKVSGWVPKYSYLPSNIQWGFCCNSDCNNKTHISEKNLGPSGSYCIFRCGGSCPKDFNVGYIYWDDKDSSNNNKKSGMLPDGTYGINTKIFFCCRHDPRLLSGLPKCSQMMLMRYKGRCPQAGNYSGPKNRFLQWDTENYYNDDRRIGVFPDGQKDFGNSIKIEFCTYTSRGRC